MPNTDQYLSTARVLIGAAGGIIGTLGVTAIDPATLQEGFNHIFNGVKEIAVGIGILAPIGAGIWGFIRNSTKGKIAAAAADPDVAKVVVKPTASGGAAEAAADPTLPKVVKETTL